MVYIASGSPAYVHDDSCIDSYPGDAKAKAFMLQDLEQGKPFALEAMHGTVVRLGDTHPSM